MAKLTKQVERRVKLVTSSKPMDLKKEAWIAFLEHLRTGFTEQSFVYRRGESYWDALSYKTLNNLMESEPENFPPAHKQLAYAEGLRWYETRANEIMLGKIPGANAAVLQIIMRNKFGWDKPQANMQISIEADFLKKVAMIESLPTIECEATKRMESPSRNGMEYIEHKDNEQ